MGQRIQFKFRPDATEQARRKALMQLQKSGVTFQPIFPGETDPELASMFAADLDDPKAEAELLRSLNASKLIAFAESAVRRKLIR